MGKERTATQRKPREPKRSARKAAVLGEGRHTYEVVADWAKLPKSKQFGTTHGVCVDRQGRVFIHNQSKDAVAIFDANGKFMESWGEEFAGGAHGMQRSDEAEGEFLYLADIERKLVAKTTLDGEIIWTIGAPKNLDGVYGEGRPFVPTNVAIAPRGDFYVADGYGQSWIHQYSSKAKWIRSWGGKGAEPGKMDCPHGIAVDLRGPTPLLVVADRANVRLQYFTLDGKHAGFVTENLRHPCHFDQRGGDLLIPDLFGRVTILDRENRLVTHLGDNPGVEKLEGYPNLPAASRVPGKFISPHAACWDADGNIYVVEWISDGRITKLRRVD